MIDWTKPLQTEDGRRKAELTGTDFDREGAQCMVLKIGGVSDCHRHPDGHAGPPFTDDPSMTIINVPEKRVMWVNITEHDGHSYYSSDLEATPRTSPHHIARVRVEYEVGQFDEEPEA